MAKTTKNTVSKTTENVVTPVVEPVVASPAPVDAVPLKAKKAPRTPKDKVSPSSVEVPVAPAVEVVAPAVADEGVPVVADVPVADVTDITTLSVKLNIFGSKLQQLNGLLSAVKTDYKTLEKTINRELKNAQKSSRRKKVSSGNRQPSGFVKPTRISDELAFFLGKASGVEMARTEVSKEINAYIRANSLQDKANGRKINADHKLSGLLKLSAQDELTYFNLQRFLKHHFVKAEVLAPAPVVA